MPRKTDRNFLADFQTLDIEYLPEKGPEVSSDIQMVYVMGNVAPAAAGAAGFVPGWATPDPILVEYGINTFTNAVAAERTRIEILAIATGGGIWITGIDSPTSSAVDCVMFTIPALTGLAATITPTAANSSAYGSGAAATAIVEHGTSLIAAPGTAERHDIGEGTSGRPEGFSGDGLTPIYIGAGRVFVVQLVFVNVGEFLGLKWREIP